MKNWWFEHLGNHPAPNHPWALKPTNSIWRSVRVLFLGRFPASKPEVSISKQFPKTELQTVAAKSKPSPGKFQTFLVAMAEGCRLLDCLKISPIHVSYSLSEDGGAGLKSKMFLKTSHTEGSGMIWWIILLIHLSWLEASLEGIAFSTDI